MLDFLRRGVKSWVAKILLALLILSFAVWGIGDIFINQGGGTVARAPSSAAPGTSVAIHDVPAKGAGTACGIISTTTSTLSGSPSPSAEKTRVVRNKASPLNAISVCTANGHVMSFLKDTCLAKPGAAPSLFKGQDSGRADLSRLPAAMWRHCGLVPKKRTSSGMSLGTQAGR